MANQLIFIVDDDAPLRGLMSALLEDRGYAVQEFESGKALLEALDDNPSLILLDVMMPGIDGPTTLQRLREIPELKQTPVIFMTAKVQPQEVAGYKNMGALDVVAKPFDPMTLAEKVKSIWEGRYD